MKLGDYRLCFKKGMILYFTDNFDKQWGDDWNDAPLDCNAGIPYDDVIDETEEKDGLRFVKNSHEIEILVVSF